MLKKRTPPAAPDLIAQYQAALLAAWDERATFAGTSPKTIAVERPAAVQLFARLADQLRREHAARG